MTSVPIVISDRPGLTADEAGRRERAGESNRAPVGSTRGYGQILRTNVFNLYNTILFGIGGALLALGRYSDALISAGLGVLNAIIGAVQEMRAKRQLDRLQQQERSPVLVVRDGRDTELMPDQVVRGDLVRVRPGDQLVVDGPLLEGSVQVAESLLTGEADWQRRTVGDDLLSGSRCVGGDGLQEARDVGAASHANRLAAAARRTATDSTPLQRQIGFCIRLIMIAVLLMSGAILLQAALEGISLERVVQITAVLSGLVPYGLFLLIVLAYTAGAVASYRRGALVQLVNAVESVSNVDVVCTDKAGTLTTGQLMVTDLTPLGSHDDATARAALGSMAHSSSGPDLTTSALAAHLPGEAAPVVDEVPYEVARGWRAVRTDGATWVLGTPEAMAGAADLDSTGGVRAPDAVGTRVLFFARALDPAAPVRDAQGQPRLPALEPIAVLTLAEELRPGVRATIAQLQEEGIALKIISGDDPAAVAAVAARAGLGDDAPVDGRRFADLSDLELDAVVAGGVAFGRVAPEQKERILASLRRQGHYAAMVGAGVDDVRALAAANVGVAMRSGSPVTREVADIVLLEDSLAALVHTRRDGRRIISGITTSAQVFLARVATQALIIVAITMLGLGFPYAPAQTGLTLFTVGLPTIFLTAWAKPRPPDPHLLRNLARFVLPAAVLTAGGAIAIYTFLYTSIVHGFGGEAGGMRDRMVAEFEQYTDLVYGVDPEFVAEAAAIGAQTGLSTFVSMASILLLLFLQPPARLFAAWTPTVADKRPAVLIVALMAGLVAALVVPALRNYFGLTQPVGIIYETVLPLLALWFAALSAVYRFRVMDRLLGLDEL